MARHGLKRSRPRELVPGTRRVISASMDYLPEAGITDAIQVLRDPRRGYVARYALGRDYHKVLRRGLVRLLQRIEKEAGGGQYRGPCIGKTKFPKFCLLEASCSWTPDMGDHVRGAPSSLKDPGKSNARFDSFAGRVFVDSAPVLEKALARNAGLGWIGKHTNLIRRQGGSCFLLGEIYTNLPLFIDRPAREHCGSCRACMLACPTGAIVAPYRLDARRCVAYLTIEYRGSIPLELRPRIGNRIFGCDDCQLACPWNRFATVTRERDFTPRNNLDGETLVGLFGWSEPEFMERTAGSALRRIGYECWLRNIAVAIGNAPPSARMVAVLEKRIRHPSSLVAEHVAWALARHRP